MKLFELIERHKAKIEKTRTITKIHLAWDALHKMHKDPFTVDFDAKTIIRIV
jgi:hypothetical protein